MSLIPDNIKTMIRNYKRNDDRYSSQLHLYLYSSTLANIETIQSKLNGKNVDSDVTTNFKVILFFIRTDEETIKNVSIKDRSILESIVLKCMRDVMLNVYPIYKI